MARQPAQQCTLLKWPVNNNRYSTLQCKWQQALFYFAVCKVISELNKIKRLAAH